MGPAAKTVRPGPRARRRVVMVLHWTQFALLIGLLSTEVPTAPWVLAYAGVTLAWTGLALVAGLNGTGGPALTPALRHVHRWGHRAMLAAVAVSGVLAILWLAGRPVALQYWLFIVFGLSMLHAIFHLWRHTTLGDGALRWMTPRAVHKVL